MELKKNVSASGYGKHKNDLKALWLQDDLCSDVGAREQPQLWGCSAGAFMPLHRDSATSLGPKAASYLLHLVHLKKHVVWQCKERGVQELLLVSKCSCLYQPLLILCSEELLPACA